MKRQLTYFCVGTVSFDIVIYFRCWNEWKVLLICRDKIHNTNKSLYISNRYLLIILCYESCKFYIRQITSSESVNAANSPKVCQLISLSMSWHFFFFKLCLFYAVVDFNDMLTRNIIRCTIIIKLCRRICLVS